MILISIVAVFRLLPYCSIFIENQRGNERFTKLGYVTKFPGGDTNTDVDEEGSKGMTRPSQDWKLSYISCFEVTCTNIKYSSK